MKRLSYLLATLSLCVVATSCDKSSDLLDEPFTPQLYHVKGKVEKGPFISGSEISLQPMDAQLQVLGSMFNTSITDNTGSFSLGQQEFTTPYAEFMANGYFFNEVKGTLSNGTLTLRALVDLRDNTTINVNVLTHLKYARIKNLVASGKKFNEANKQAQKELLNAFAEDIEKALKTIDETKNLEKKKEKTPAEEQKIKEIKKLEEHYAKTIERARKALKAYQKQQAKQQEQNQNQTKQQGVTR